MSNNPGSEVEKISNSSASAGEEMHYDELRRSYRDRHTFGGPLTSEQYGVAKLGLILISLISALIIASLIDNKVTSINEETRNLINNLFNLIYAGIVPLSIGMTGAIARIFLSGASFDNQVRTTVGSGLMATFSWMGIKSGLLLSIIAPHLEKQVGLESSGTIDEDNFYMMALIAVFVGMYSPNLFSAFNDRVSQMTNLKAEKHLTQSRSPDSKARGSRSAATHNRSTSRRPRKQPPSDD